MGEWEPQKLNHRHQAIMEMLFANPGAKEYEVAAAIGCTPQTVYNIVSSELFQLAFSEWRKSHREKLSDLVMDATVDAIKFEHSVVKGKILSPAGEWIEIDSVALRQTSARDILSLGHAKAIDKHLNANVNLGLEDALLEIQKRNGTNGGSRCETAGPIPNNFSSEPTGTATEFNSALSSEAKAAPQEEPNPLEELR